MNYNQYILPPKILEINQLVEKNEKELMEKMIELNFGENNEKNLMEKMTGLNFGERCNKLKIAKLDDLDKIINPDNLTEVPTKEYSDYYIHYKARVIDIYLDGVVKIEDRDKLDKESNINDYKKNIFNENMKTYYLELPFDIMEKIPLKNEKSFFDSHFYKLGSLNIKQGVKYLNEPLSKYFNICKTVKKIIEKMNDKEILKNLWVVSDKVIEFIDKKNETIRRIEDVYDKNATVRGIEDVYNDLNEQDFVETNDDTEGGKRKSRRHLKRKSRKSRKKNKKASKKSKKSRRSRKSRKSRR